MFRLAVEACPAAMLMVGADGVIQLVNDECERMFGYERSELIGASIDLLAPGHVRQGHKALRDSYAVHPSKRLMGAGRDLRAVRKDESEFPVEIGLTPISTPGGPCVLAFVIDITARREAEKSIRGYMAELERANEGLARFAYMASHDIQEPLRKIVSFADILTTAVGEKNFDDLLHASKVMEASARQARTLVSDILTFARSLNSAYDLKTISVRDVVESALQNLSQAVLDEAAVVELAIEDFDVHGDRTQAILLLQNIVANALKYHKPGARPVVRISTDAAVRRMAIADEGIGFPPTTREDIFEPFKRLHTRDQYPGSGIGLAICKTIASRHGWRISATPTSQGACFEVIFTKASADAFVPAIDIGGAPGVAKPSFPSDRGG